MKWQKRVLYGFVGCVLAFFTVVKPAMAEKAKTLTFGIVPQQSATRLIKKWTPIFKYLSDKTGYNIQFKTAPSIPVFERRVLKGDYDLAYMNPYHYTVFCLTPGYKAFAKQKNKRIKGIIVVRKDAPYEGLADLEGKTLAFPSPAAFAASILTRAQFQNEKIAITPKYVNSHDSVYRSVARGMFSAGGGIVRTFNTVDESIRSQLKIFWTSNPYTPHAFAAHPDLAAETVEQIKQAMIGMNNDPKAQPLLKAINFKGIEAAQDKDWDDVRALKIYLLDDMAQK